MEVKREHEDKVDEEILMDADNPHRYLFGDDPIEPPAPETMPPLNPIHQAPQVVEPIVPKVSPVKTAQPTSPTPSKAAEPASRKHVRHIDFDERFKSTIEYVLLETDFVEAQEHWWTSLSICCLFFAILTSVVRILPWLSCAVSKL